MYKRQPTDDVVDFFGEMYTDTEICLPEIEIDGTTTLVLSHRGVMVYIEPVSYTHLDVYKRQSVF